MRRMRMGDGGVFVASCDCLTPTPGSRYGAHPDAEIVDGLVVEALKASDPGG